MLPKWNIGQQFTHKETGYLFEVSQVVALAPQGRIGYTLKPVGEVDVYPPGGELRRFETELDTDEWVIVIPTPQETP